MPDVLFGLDLSPLRLDLLGRLVLAAVLGGIVGMEREWSGKPAGFRTNLLICVGAALLTELSISVARAADPFAMADPGRIAAQIVSGIGFLGAGTIIQSRAGVVGLTTAATLWVVAAIGMAVGAGAFVEAVGATVLVVIALLVLGQLEPRLHRHREVVLRVTMGRDTGTVEQVEALLDEPLQVQVMEAERTEEQVSMTYHIYGHRDLTMRLVDRLLEIDGVRTVVRR
jgi:putative Mg2+ transporter-C (MgtC) family protein